MTEYIERKRAIVDACNSLELYPSEYARLEDAITKIPAADVEPVRHGRCDDSGKYRFPGGSIAVRCSECGCALTVSEYKLNNWNYCPVCGAKMGGDNND